METKLLVLPHEPLSNQEIEKARSVVENLPWQNCPQDFAVSFEFLAREGVLFVFKQNKENEDVSWVAFSLVYKDSGNDCQQLPDTDV